MSVYFVLTNVDDTKGINLVLYIVNDAEKVYLILNNIEGACGIFKYLMLNNVESAEGVNFVFNNVECDEMVHLVLNNVNGAYGVYFIFNNIVGTEGGTLSFE